MSAVILDEKDLYDNVMKAILEGLAAFHGVLALAEHLQDALLEGNALTVRSKADIDLGQSKDLDHVLEVLLVRIGRPNQLAQTGGYVLQGEKRRHQQIKRLVV